VVFEAHRGEADQARVASRRPGAVNELESRMADLRRVEADLETIRQAHYAAGDQVNQAQGKLYEASAEVGRLEAEIRFVVEGRQRVEQRLVPAGRADRPVVQRAARGRGRAGAPGRAGVDAEEKAELLAAQVEEQAMRCPTWKKPCARPRARPTNSVPAWCRCSSKSRCWRPISATLRSKAASSPLRRERLRADRNALAAPDEARWPTCKPVAEAERPPRTADARLHELQDQVPQLDEDRRARQQAVNPRPPPGRLSARLEALKALQEKVKTDGKLRPGWPNTGWTACRACGAASTSSPAGKMRWKPRCASAWARSKSPPGHGARLLGARCARRQAGLLQRRRRRVPTPAAANGLPRLSDLLRCTMQGRRRC
jgi:chromosome segregation protein